jgi:hypothetical protein
MFANVSTESMLLGVIAFELLILIVCVCAAAVVWERS